MGWDEVGWAVLSFIIGAGTGISEIVSRYRDEPLRATANRYGFAYLALNGLISVLAYAFLVRYSSNILTSVAGDPVMTSIVAGFGAMAILRSNFFIFRTEDGKEYPIGPSIVVETFLRMLDRKIDRLRASERQRRVLERLKDIADYDAAANYLEASLLSFQNLTEKEWTDIREVIEVYRKKAWPPALRVYAVGFAFLTIAGEENFDQVVENLQKYLEKAKESALMRLGAPVTETDDD
jgi:hypothetical protein